MAKFEKMRVSLARNELPPLLEAVDHIEDTSTRSAFLKATFASEQHFFGRGKVPLKFQPIESPDGFVAGFFSKPSPKELNDADLSPYLAENYEAALFVLSLDKAQVIWMQDTRVGSPKAVLETYFRHMASKGGLRDWTAYVRYFEEEGSYWDAVARYRSEITQIVFRYVPPNAFEGKKLAQRYHTAVQEQAKNAMLVETFKSAPGQMDPEAEMMRANAEIAEQGAGEKELRGRGNKVLYNSANGKKTADVPDDDMPDLKHQSFLRRVIDRLFGE